MANHPSILFSGKSGERYRFQVWPLDTRFKNAPAVVMFTKRSFPNTTFAERASHECVGVCQTADLATLGAREYQLAKDHGADYVCVYVEAEADRRQAIEQDLVDAGNAWGSLLKLS